ncbi:MAG: polysaccharide biosynthesis/export family protein [Tepidisphaeraceae bacterium]
MPPLALPRFALAACLAAALVAGGCESTGSLDKGWFNPGEVGRFGKEPLMLPIVSTLSTDYEEPNDQFSQAIDVAAEDLVAAPQDYVVGRNDLLAISITDLVAPGVETVKQARVSESGNISMPLVGPIRAEGLTEAQLEAEIQRVYREQNLMPQAQVTVSVQKALARTFSILGSVARPGQYQITQGDFRILDALVTAGDVNSQGVDYLYVIRRDKGASPATEPAAPAGAPGTTQPPAPRDPLAPQSLNAPSIGNDPGEYKTTTPDDLKRVALLVQDAPAPTPPADTDGRSAIIDGKVVPAPSANEGATAAPAADAPPPPPGPAAVEPAPTTPPSAPTAMAPATADKPEGFAFNDPSSGTNARVIRVPVTQLKNGDLRYNIVVRPQDMIIAPLPTTGEYYMDGHVNRTGVYSLTARNITLKQAIAAAGGFDQLAIPTRTEIVRRVGMDKEVFAVVNMDKVFAGETPDIYLKPNDMVRVGTNATAPFIAAFRNAFRVTYGFGFLYDRNFAPNQRQQN